MKKSVFTKVLSVISLAAVLTLSFSSCGSGEYNYTGYTDERASRTAAPQYYKEPEEIDSITKAPADGNDVSYKTEIKLEENKSVKTADQPISTFSADVDTASYTEFRNLVQNGTSYEELVSNYAGWFRTEEFVNYFKYDYKGPENGELFGVNASVFDCPWNADRKVLVLGLATETELPETVTAGNNYVFLIDVSGSMASSNKLPLLQQAFSYLTKNLGPDDLVSIVTYSGKEAVVLDGASASQKDEILNAVNQLKASGSTNGEAGLEKAYELAEKHFIEGGNNRIIMASDGDLNVGISDPEQLEAYISDKKSTGVYLSVLGFGSGNYRDSNMEALADSGNGAYYYIDSMDEAEKVFGEDLQATLYTVGTDVKIQLTFNTAEVLSYRLIGYENRQLETEDFTDDTKDAGEVGAGHQVTVIYELELANGDGAASEDFNTGDIAKLAIRYKKPGETESTLQEKTLGASVVTADPSVDAVFAVSVAQAVLLIRDSEYITNEVNLLSVASKLTKLGKLDEDKTEFIKLVKTVLKTQVD